MNSVTKTYTYNYTNPKTGFTRVKRVTRKYKINPKPQEHQLEQDEVMKEYNYSGHKIVRYYKVKNVESVERNISGSGETESIQQITEKQTNS
jgi:hypothetical protein